MSYTNIEPPDYISGKNELTEEECLNVLDSFINGIGVQKCYRQFRLPKNLVIKLYMNLKELEKIADELMIVVDNAPEDKTFLRKKVKKQSLLISIVLKKALNARIKAATTLGTFDEYKRVANLLATGEI